MGYRHLLAYDHVVGADPAVHARLERALRRQHHLSRTVGDFGFLAAIPSLELVTGVIILPQRQTALVAKQAAEVDLLTAGRFRLGVGIGWNAVEYEALGKDFAHPGPAVRGADRAAAAAVDRAVRDFRTATVRQVTGAGISPLPVQRPIPVWIGGLAPGLRADGRLADGWFPQVGPGPSWTRHWRGRARGGADAGRDPASRSAWRRG